MRLTTIIIAVFAILAAAPAAAHHTVHADDFDLEAVTDIALGGGVSDAAQLEAHVNGDTGINNVDLDHDGIIDDVIVEERRDVSGAHFDFYAIPSHHRQYSERVHLGSLKFHELSNGDVEVHASYADDVGDHHAYAHTYVVHHRTSFLTWVSPPHPSLHVVSYRPHHYHSRPVYRVGYRTHHRSRSAYHGASHRYRSSRVSRSRVSTRRSGRRSSSRRTTRSHRVRTRTNRRRRRR
jgi:hypothetical protein